MIDQIRIKDYALIENLEVSFDSGLNVITGETGSGKSILISAFNFVLGERADKTLVRTGATQAVVEAEFSIEHNTSVGKSLEELGIEYEDMIVITRKINLDGRNEIRLNGSVVTQAMLKKVTEHLVDIYGQHEHQVLLDEARHIEFVDEYIGADALKSKNILREEIHRLNSIKTRIKELGGDESERERECEMLNYQIEELEQANLHVGEDDELAEKKIKFQNKHKIVDAINQAHQGLTGDSDNANGVVAILKTVARTLFPAGEMDSQLKEHAERLESARIEIEDIADGLGIVLDDYYFSESEFEQIDARLDLIKALKRKYGKTIPEMIVHLDTIKQRLVDLRNSEFTISKLEKESEEILSSINTACAELSELRKTAALRIEARIVDELSQLGMQNARFNINFEEVPFSAEGTDKVNFLFSANKGEPLKALTKVISGGEMSRFMLAFKVVLGEAVGIKTLVFDEIDSGISGVVSVAVSQKLARLARNNQVITVTHLATIAAMADSHYRISKSVKDEKTVSAVEKLDTSEQLEEIARLTGGDNKSQLGLEHAAELKQKCIEFKATLD